MGYSSWGHKESDMTERVIRTQIRIPSTIQTYLGLPCSSAGKESSCSAGDPGSIPGLGRSPGEGHGNPLQYSCLENPMGRRAWRAIVHGVARVGHDLATKPPPLPGTFRSFSSAIDNILGHIR